MQSKLMKNQKNTKRKHYEKGRAFIRQTIKTIYQYAYDSVPVFLESIEIKNFLEEFNY